MRYHGRAFRGMKPEQDILVTKAGVFYLQANPGFRGALCYACALRHDNMCGAVRGIAACGGIERVRFVQMSPVMYDLEAIDQARDLLALKGELK